MIETPEISIIIPYFNRWDLTHKRMMELYKHAPDSCEIILIDDCSTEDESIGGVAWWQKHGPQRHRVRYYRNPENVGFGASCNNGGKLAAGRVVVFLSNDVCVYGDIFSDIVTLIGLSDTMLVGGRIVDFPGGWNEFTIDGKCYIIPYVEGWLMACTKKAWKTLGGFDPRYGKYDYEDVDLTMTAMKNAFTIVGMDSNKVFHMVGQTIASLHVDRQSITFQNRTVFFDKWKNIIPTVEGIQWKLPKS